MTKIIISILLLLCPAQSHAFFGFGKAVLMASKGGAATPSFAPDQVSGLTSWYKSDSGPTPAVNGSTITAWADKSTTANNLISVTGHPAYISSVQNGKPGIYFDGGSVIVGSNLADTNQPITAYLVMRPTLWNNGYSHTPVTMYSSGAGMIYEQAANAYISLYTGVVLNGPTISQGNTYIIKAVWNGASSSISVNGGAATTGNAGANPNYNLPEIGAGTGSPDNAFVGYVFEWLVYTGLIADGDNTKIMTYLNGSSRWAVY